MTLVEWQQKLHTVEDRQRFLSRNNGGPPGLYALGVDIDYPSERIGTASTCTIVRLVADKPVSRWGRCFTAPKGPCPSGFGHLSDGD